MKKTYITPKAECVRLMGHTMLQSLSVKDDYADEDKGMESKEYSGGLLWEGDNEE